MNRFSSLSLVAALCVASSCCLALQAQEKSDMGVPNKLPELQPRPTQGMSVGNGVGNGTATGAAYLSDPKFQKALAQAKEGRQTTEERLDNWKHANKVAKGQCVECLHHMITMEMKLSAWKDVVNTARELEALNAGDKETVFAEAEMAHALMHYNYGSPKPADLALAEATFREVLQKVPKARDLIFDDGRALAMMGKMDEAKAMFERYVDITPASDRYHARAERFADDPHVATLPLAPPFRMVTTDGEQLQLDDMNGKVVLLDFWATWCGPCKETLPDVARIAKEYANDPMLVVISVSQDRDESAWKTFVQKNNMTWPQYRDANNALGTAYGVTSIPRFFSIDTDGVLKSEKVGSGTNIHAMVSDLLKKAHKVEAKKAKDSEKSGE